MSRQGNSAPKAMILAAGKGTRLRPLTDRIPKAMVPVGGRPLLEHTVELLRRHGVTRIAINLHAHAHVIPEHFGDGSRFGVSLTYSFEPQLLGTAGAVKRLEEFFDDGAFYVVYGDVLTRLDLGSLLAYHRRCRPMVTIALHQPADPERCGVVEQDESGWITRFVEKPEGGISPGAWANAGIYVLEPEVLDEIRADGPQDFGEDVFPRIVGNGRMVAGFRSDAAFWDVGWPGRLRLAEASLRTDPDDPRTARITDAAGEYIGPVQEAISALDCNDIARVAELILDARARGGRVYIAGNGGSAATASHMASDLVRAAAESPGPPLRCHSLADCVPVLTALSNDVDFESSFGLQVEQLIEPGDVLVLISASGQSPNIIAAARAAQKHGASVVGLAGFGGGRLAEIADAAVVVRSHEYGPVEDIHLLINHLLATVIRRIADPMTDSKRHQQSERRLQLVGAGVSGPGADQC